MFNKKMKKFAAAALSAAVLMGSGSAVLHTVTSAVAAEEEKSTVTLNIAGGAAQEAADEEAADSTETETETEEETEVKVNYEKLSSTKSGGHAVTVMDVSEIVEDNMPSIVAITETSVQEVETYFYGKQQYKATGSGSGVIIAQNDDELLIVTNNHVVEDATEMTVCFSVDAEDTDDLVVPAVVKGTDPDTDLAVVAVKLADIKEDVYNQLKIATLGSSSDLKVGEAAILIGNALGEGQSVSAGIVSALERDITTEAGTFNEFQIDANVNLGCSGGAILDSNGEVIGIFNAKAVADYADGMGYGIPIDTAIPVLTELINRETRSTVENHGYLGVTVVPVSDEAMQMYSMPAGAFVYEVTEGSAAADAGIKQGDIITKLDGIKISSSDKLVETIGYYEVGETVTVEVMSNEGGSYTAREVEVTLQAGAASEDDAQEKTDAPKEEKKGDKKDEKKNEEREDEEPEAYGSDPFDDFGQFFFGDGFGQGRGNGQF